MAASLYLGSSTGAPDIRTEAAHKTTDNIPPYHYFHSFLKGLHNFDLNISLTQKLETTLASTYIPRGTILLDANDTHTQVTLHQAQQRSLRALSGSFQLFIHIFVSLCYHVPLLLTALLSYSPSLYTLQLILCTYALGISKQ